MRYAADWTKPGSFSAGRDPLGFQAASVRLYTSLVPGLTNVTNRLRYYSFYCWVVWQFERIHHTTKEDKWIEFIRRCEAAIALACQIGDAPNAFGMAGSDWGRLEAADFSKKTFDLIKPTDRPGEDGQYLKAKYGNFGQFYTASMLEMRLIDNVSDRVYGVTSNAGKALAEAVQEEHPEACRLLLKAVKAGRISRSDCEAISEALHPSYLDPSSQEARLLKVFLQGARADDPTAEARRTSLRNLLAVVSDTKGEFDLRRDHPGSQRVVRRVLPQVAVQTAKRTLAVRQEQRRHRLDAAACGSLILHQKSVRARRVDRVLRATRGEDLATRVENFTKVGHVWSPPARRIGVRQHPDSLQSWSTGFSLLQSSLKVGLPPEHRLGRLLLRNRASFFGKKGDRIWTIALAPPAFVHGPQRYRRSCVAGRSSGHWRER